MMMPWLLIIIGFIFLMENLNLIPGIRWCVIWPSILILAGIYMLRKRSGDGCCGWFEKKEEEKK